MDYDTGFKDGLLKAFELLEISRAGHGTVEMIAHSPHYVQERNIMAVGMSLYEIANKLINLQNSMTRSFDGPH